MEKVSERDLVLFVLNIKGKYESEKLEKEVLRATKDFGISEKKDHPHYIRETIAELVGIGALKETRESSMGNTNTSYSISIGGKRIFNNRFAKLMKDDKDEKLFRRLDEYFYYLGGSE